VIGGQRHWAVAEQTAARRGQPVALKVADQPLPGWTQRQLDLAAVG
jgi:hypothetical protein